MSVSIHSVRRRSSYREARRVAFGQAVARLQQGASAAATTLLKVMLDQNASASVRVRAAECVMNQATKAIEIEDIEARVAARETGATSSATARPAMRILVEGLGDKPKP